MVMKSGAHLGGPRLPRPRNWERWEVNEDGGEESRGLQGGRRNGREGWVEKVETRATSRNRSRRKRKKRRRKRRKRGWFENVIFLSALA